MSQGEARIVAALGRRAGKARAPAGFDERLWDAIDAIPPASRRRPSAAALALVAVTLTAAAVLIVFLWPSFTPDAPAGPALAIVVEPGDGPPRRSSEASPGDRARVSARLEGAAFGELRVYRDDTVLLVRCSDSPPCERFGDELEADLPLDAPGIYQIALLRSEAPLPPPAGDLDRDVAAAIEAGADATLRRLEVR